MQEYECTVCGYIYVPDVGNVSEGIDYGTPFEELPEEWECPVCAAGKEEFKPINEELDEELEKVHDEEEDSI